MRIIISPAKKMREDTDGMPWKDLPQFISKTERIYKQMQSMSYGELKKLWKCNDHIATQNYNHLKKMNLQNQLTPAIFAYDGIQYQYMAPSVFTDDELDYIQNHLRIFSGFYGLVRPFDGVTAYRLEMQAKLSIDEKKDLYDYWGSSIANQLFSETNCIINLASKEYSRCVSKYLSDEIQFITCIFGELIDGKIVEKGTMCKMARGEMVRYMAEVRASVPEQLKLFSRLEYVFSEEHSTESTYVYLKSKSKDVQEDF